MRLCQGICWEGTLTIKITQKYQYETDSEQSVMAEWVRLSYEVVTCSGNEDIIPHCKNEGKKREDDIQKYFKRFM